ncbi:serine/threonine-protein kinase TTK/MPS1 [Nematocida ausubeli]|uniref:Protein kinase domain-containing protein n=1 Tax=Nematocida ausubeli (strain ATCC PRA-371 / ERTm2) TaxID=1913371 RepID=A0A086J094_NEMA1|nr:uncharacterized protein NESG_02341 [Nematocida ausubeli]KAI5149989.1 serine/threonine-protein kinase TTK/MPS1 [Nematocida ausubeli]KAI5160670.1 serine/threonine-protein kinase TTK/MPS1 [Nematocida ausubeli]KFG25562.1 hypothetical protein NESG_02341 [Nematocida ausubeli]
MERLFHIEDILAYIEEQKRGNASATRQLSMYYEATQKNLEANEKTHSLWEGYIHTLEKNGYAHTEIREVYKMLKSKFWRFLQFWQGWFSYESRLPIDQSKRAKVLELANDILQYKECAGKEKILAWVREKSVGTAKENNMSRTMYMSPETPKSHLYMDTTDVEAHRIEYGTRQAEHAGERAAHSMDREVQMAELESNSILGGMRRSYAFREAAGMERESPREHAFSGVENSGAGEFQYMERNSRRAQNGGGMDSKNAVYIKEEAAAHKRFPALRQEQSFVHSNMLDGRDEKPQAYLLEGAPNMSMNLEIELGRSAVCAAPGYFTGSGENEAVFVPRSESMGKTSLSSWQESRKEQQGYEGEYRDGREAESNRENRKNGTITEAGDVFDFKIGTRTMEGQETEILENSRNAGNSVCSEKYLNAPASKKITLNGKKLRILRTIGKGGSAKVYQVLSDKNEVFALKKIRILQNSEDSEVYKSYANEISLLKRLKSRHEIVTLKDSYINRDRIAILMEYGDIDLCRFLEIEKERFPGGYRKSNENYTMISIWEQMLRAVKCIHEHRIVHRDLKPGNFLFVSGRLKLIDFGISKEIRNDTTNIIREKQIGTINYMSPEAIIEGKTKMGRNSDIWSLGCILYEMYFGESPFMRFKNLVQRMQKLLDPEYTVELPEEESDDNNYQCVAAEIKKCLVREPKERAKIDMLLRSGLCSLTSKETVPAQKVCTFSKQELKEFISKIMDLRHTATTEEGHEKIIEKITSLYFDSYQNQ